MTPAHNYLCYSQHEVPTAVPPRRSTTVLTIDIQTARRFILGKQGLWPGRRWRAS